MNIANKRCEDGTCTWGKLAGSHCIAPELVSAANGGWWYLHSFLNRHITLVKVSLVNCSIVIL